MATASRVPVAKALKAVPLGAIDPEHAVTPRMFVTRVLRVERRIGARSRSIASGSPRAPCARQLAHADLALIDVRAEGLHVVEIVGEALSFPQLQRLTAAPIKASRERLKRGARDLSAPTRTPLEFGKDAFGRCIG